MQYGGGRIVDLPATIGLAIDMHDLAVALRAALHHRGIATATERRVAGIAEDASVELFGFASFTAQLTIQLQLLLSLACKQLALALGFTLALQLGAALQFSFLALVCEQVVIGAGRVVFPLLGTVMTR